MNINKYFSLLTILFLLACKEKNINKKEFKRNLIQKDTIYILFDNSLNKVSKHKMFQYKNKEPNFYKIIYDIPVYWEQERDTLEDGSLNEGYRFIGDYNHSFWYGTYKVRPEYPEFDDSQIYGSSGVLKKHKSFLIKHKSKVIDYSWFKKHTPPSVWKILKPNKLNKNKPTLFLIDKDEYTKDSITLKNVIYHPPVIQ